MSGAETKAELTPVTAGERVELIDILRGFALLGILLVNFWGNTSEAAAGVDRVMNAVLDVAISSSFYPLFSFLFGLGFAMQLLRARERGAAVVGVYLRRMLALFLIGTVHAVLIWEGDILVYYALTGLLLIPLHPLRDQWLIPLAAALLVLLLWEPRVQAYMGQLGGPDAAEMTMLRETETNKHTFAMDNANARYEIDRGAPRLEAFASAVAVRWSRYEREVRNQFSSTFFLDDILAFFVIGLIVGRRRLLEEAERHRKGFAFFTAGALLAAVGGNLVMIVVEPEAQMLEALAWSLANYGVTALYVGALTLLVTGWSRVAAALRPFAAAGRIGLTNYLMQSLVMTLLFSAYGFGMPNPTTTLWVLINLSFFFGVQVPFSRWWVARYRFGPAEWLWRTMTYGKPQPMRLSPPAAAPAPALELR